MRYPILAATVLAMAVCGPARASSYFAIEGSSVSIDNSLEDELNPLGLRLRLGTRIGESIDIEGHVGFTSDNDNDRLDEFGTSYMGAYLKAYVPLGLNSALFGAAGYTSVELTQKINQQEFTDDRTGFSYGFGMETRLSDSVDLTADYMRYLRDEGLFEEISAVSFGIKVYF